jgi:hypothetical protein
MGNIFKYINNIAIFKNYLSEKKIDFSDINDLKIFNIKNKELYKWIVIKGNIMHINHKK